MANKTIPGYEVYKKLLDLSRQNTANANYRFRQNQKVRVRRTINDGVDGIEDFLGRIAVIEERYADSGGEVWYRARVGKRVEPFRESELGQINQHIVIAKLAA